MTRPGPSKALLLICLIFATLSTSIIFSQSIQVEVVGGSAVSQGSTISINAGNSLSFRITNIETTNCLNLKIKDVYIANTTDFSINPASPKANIKPVDCPGGKKYLDFEVENINSSCAAASTLITIEIKDQSDFTFTLEVNSSPVISVTGGSPLADINNGDSTTSAANGTYFGVVEEGASVTRNFIIVNTGSCPLEIQGIKSFNDSPQYPMGLVVAEDGLIRIRIDAVENIQSGINFYIKDELTGLTHNLNESPFEHFLQAGEYEGRFSIVLQPGYSAIDNTNSEIGLIGLIGFYDSSSESIMIRIPEDNHLKAVNLYNITGQHLLSAKTFTGTGGIIGIPVDFDEGIYPEHDHLARRDQQKDRYRLNLTRPLRNDQITIS